MAVTLRSGRALEEPKTSDSKGVQATGEKEAYVEETRTKKKNSNEAVSSLSKLFLDNPSIIQPTFRFL